MSILQPSYRIAFECSLLSMLQCCKGEQCITVAIPSNNWAQSLDVAVRQPLSAVLRQTNSSWGRKNIPRQHWIPFSSGISIVLSSSSASNMFDTQQPNSPPGAAELRGSRAPTQASLQSLASRPEAYVPGRWETPCDPMEYGWKPHIFRLLHIIMGYIS